MGRLVRFAGLASVFMSVIACAGEVEDAATAGGGPSTAPSTSPVDVALKPPVLTGIEAFSSVLRLTWEAPSPCDVIDGERRTPESMFEVIFSVPGTDTVYVDADAIKDTSYTYRLRCQLGFVSSGYSNEMTANPSDG